MQVRGAVIYTRAAEYLQVVHEISNAIKRPMQPMRRKFLQRAHTSRRKARRACLVAPLRTRPAGAKWHAMSPTRLARTPRESEFSPEGAVLN